ncbi:50S ribosomal protein P1 [archaeon]|nr:50S ribosomal protein P1 [archaeon]
MNLIYDALLLHSAGQEINEANVKKVADATGASVDEAQIKALVAALDGVDITDAISKAAVAGPVAAPAGGDAASDAGAEKKEEKSAEEVEKKAEEAAEGLSSLFG